VFAENIVMATEHHSAGASRRSLMAAVLALPAVALPAAAPAADADAALVADCDAWLRLEVEYHRVMAPWCYTPTRMQRPAALQAYMDRLSDQQDTLSARIEEAQPRTLAGFAALARMGMVHLDLDMDGSPSHNTPPAVAVLCRALGGKSMAQLIRDETCPDPVEPADAPAPMSALSVAFVEAVEAEPSRRCTEAAMARYLPVQLRLIAEGAI
jgi:hypothetical protein